MKYLHYMPVPSPIYNHMVIDIINENKSIPGEHYFYLLDKVCYEQDSKYENVFYKANYSVRKLNKDSQKFDYVVVHGLNFNYKEQIQISKKTAQKIVWCVWGHDLYKERDCVYSSNIWKNLKITAKKCLIRVVWVPLVRKFAYIGIGFPYDRFEIYRLVGKSAKILPVAYGLGYDFNIVKEIKEASKLKKHDGINILIGHSAYPFLNHIELLEKLKKYENENITVVLPLSYGDDAYKERLMTYLKDYPLKKKVITDFMSPKKYIQLLSQIDIAIFDYKHQAALANIYLLLYLEKKLYLDLSGIVAKGLKSEHVEVFDVNDIGKQSFAEVCAFNYSLKEGLKVGERRLNEENIIKQWRMLFEECEKR